MEGSAVVAVPAPVQLGPAPWSRLAVSAGFALLCAAALFVPLPGTAELRRQLHGGLLGLFDLPGPASLGILAVGLAPIVSAYTVVELAAVLVPSWRRLRIGGEPGRAKLRPFANGLAALLAVFQAGTIASYLRGLARSSIFDAEPSLRYLPWAALVLLPLGTLGLALVIKAIDRWGLGDGFSIVSVGLLAPGVLSLGTAAVQAEPSELLVFGLVALAVAWASARALQRRWPFAVAGEPFPLEVPPSGLAPLVIASSLVMLLTSAAGLVLHRSVDPLRFGMGYAIGMALLVACLGVALALLFNQPRRVAEVWFGSAGGEAERAAIRAQLGRATLRGTAFLVGLALLHDAAPQVLALPFFVDFSLLVVAVAVALDVAQELLFRRSQPELVPVWPMHRVYAAEPARAALAGAGIPAFVRALHHRTLLQFLGPYLPMTVLVPPAHAEAAERILRETLTRSA